MSNLVKGKCVGFVYRYYSSSKGKKGTKYSNTLILPKTKLPLRLEKAALLERDNRLKTVLESKDLFKWQQENLEGSTFVLHDGPPYANGDLHMGHAINKILKDAVLRYRILKRQKVHFIPGWDCHGLPIELKVSKCNLSTNVEPMEVRQKAKQFAEKTIVKQKQVFRSWGIIGDWDNNYTTNDASYMKKQLTDFYCLYKEGLIFRDLKPVYWSPSSRTALAEAELEYNKNHKSIAIITKMEIKYFTITGNFNKEKIYALIWTTTPWTLPCNQAISCKANISYSLVRSSSNNELYVIASKLLEDISQKLNITLEVIRNFLGHELIGSKYYHPLFEDYLLPIVLSDYVSDDKGTGLVHIAPAHGPEDFVVALKYKLPVKSFVNKLGCYTENVGSDLNGHFVLGTGQEIVLKKLENKILHCEEYIHSYPYDWRTKKPVILRASHQWFINTDKIKDKAIELLEDVKIYPKSNNETHKKTLISQLKKRPYWCISRQRVWGVPIPVFYEKSTEKALVDESIINHLCDLIDKNKGFDFWWQLPVKDLIPSSIIEKLGIMEENISKGQDILDIWFDSGISWSTVLDDKIADLYLEGVDQFTGWFQSSLITSVALRNRSPYKSLYVHGFAVDENKQKMSKSLGNVIYPDDIVKGSKKRKAYGIDVLRWWVVCHASRENVVEVSDSTLQACTDEVQKIRSVLRYAVSILNDFSENEKIEKNSLQIIDKYLLHLLWKYGISTQQMYENYHFSKIGIDTVNFLTNSVSSLYYPAIKDRLYCEFENNPSRRAAQFVLLEIFNVVTRNVAPMVPHLAEELYDSLSVKKEDSIFKTCHTINNNWNNDTLNDFVEKVLLSVKKDLHKSVGANVAPYKIWLTLTEDFYKIISNMQPDAHKMKSELCDFFQISDIEVDVENLSGKNYIFKFEKSSLFVCDRCRRFSADKEYELCNRCSSVVGKIHKESLIN
ncbi:isoleucine--tRNA ligase, mitochondrial isoform X2 [Agrilus planipennis]|uniref:isoleucine--tRNA ligase n=1 Tax=Agrilus planipennis TaxID=224129 RepID=A0A1W4WJW9_AGRPL|nr:isoleucine--tRNA ligase, mitochondrial isoform X2 [Agrilus planipennis]